MRTTEPVTIRPTKHKDYPDGFVVRYPGPGGKRVAKLFTNEPDANEFAGKRMKELGEVGKSFGSMTEAERTALTYWRGFVASVPEAPPPDLLSVLQEYGDRWKASRSSKTVAAAVDAYEAAKTAEGLRRVSLNSIRARCGRFAKDFGGRPISSITAAEISDWILGLPAARPRRLAHGKAGKGAAVPQVGLQAKRNHRLALSGLFNFAKSRGWVKDNPVLDAAKPRPPKTRPGILRPAEVARLFGALEKAAPSLVPFWSVRFFAGIREQEALRMDWSMIDMAGGEIHLPDTVTKTGRSRTVKIEPALAAFLAPHKQPDGPIAPATDMTRRYRLRLALRLLEAEDAKAAEEAKAGGESPPRPFPVPMPANGARHSFATFHLLAFRHAGETALQLGHGESPELLHRHYKGIATEAEAKAFWAIRPKGKAANVVAFKPQAKPAVEWPAPEVLQELLWQKPAVEIAAMLGVSDKAVEKHAKKHGLTRPPRGHWLKSNRKEAGR
jgi:integrase